jgi:hypothetical protein
MKSDDDEDSLVSKSSKGNGQQLTSNESDSESN